MACSCRRSPPRERPRRRTEVRPRGWRRAARGGHVFRCATAARGPGAESAPCPGGHDTEAGADRPGTDGLAPALSVRHGRSRAGRRRSTDRVRAGKGTAWGSGHAPGALRAKPPFRLGAESVPQTGALDRLNGHRGRENTLHISQGGLRKPESSASALSLRDREKRAATSWHDPGAFESTCHGKPQKWISLLPFPPE